MRIWHGRDIRQLALTVVLCAATLVGLAPRAGATSYQEKVLYSFCRTGGTCPDGAAPFGGLLMWGGGELFGTTANGGNAQNAGVVFELTPNATRTAWTETVLHRFCSAAGCADGSAPVAGLIGDALYGTTSSGGTGSGVVFALRPNTTRTKWSEAVLHDFCSETGCADGAVPFAGLLMSGEGNFYGTAQSTGTASIGVVFNLRRDATGWHDTVIHSFCSQPDCADGSYSEAGLIMDGAGNLYGTAGFGGAHNAGVVFELSPPAPGGTGWTETVLYSFDGQTPGIVDGYWPQAGLVMDQAGNLYGTTVFGGTLTCAANEWCGVVFEVSPNASRTRWTERVLYAFCPPPQSFCPEGHPYGPLILDQAGNLYGTSVGYHDPPLGTVFELAPNADRSAWTHKVLYSFCSAGCADGAGPRSGVIMDRAGNLYGTTVAGGNSDAGVVYELVKSP